MSYLGNAPVISAVRTVSEFTATAGQTVFNPTGGYTVGYLDVFRNGSQLQSADFTATNGTSVTLAQAASAGDDLRFVAWGTFSLSTIADGSITPSKLSQPFTAGTAVASTSGTSIDFTNIPSWVKRITINFNSVSTNGGSPKLIQLGTSGGVQTTNYNSASGYIGSSSGFANFTSGIGINTVSAANIMYGSVVLSLLNSSDNTWSAFGTLSLSDAAFNLILGGAKTLNGVLTTVRITTVNGTDAYDLGSINILYE